MSSPSLLQGAATSNLEFDAAWSLLLVSTRTGEIVEELPVLRGPSWSCGLGDQGYIDVTTVPRAVKLSTAQVRALTAPWRFSAVLAYGNWLAQGGPIGPRAFDDDSRVLRLRAFGLGRLFNRRAVLPGSHTFFTDAQGQHLGADNDTLFGPGTTMPDGRTIPAANRDLSTGTVIKRLVAQACTRGGTVGALPIAYQADVAGSTQESIKGSDLRDVWTTISNISDNENGADFEFRPRFTPNNPGYVEWLLRTGNPRLGKVDTAAVYDYGASLTHLSTDEDPANMAGDQWVKGSGGDYGTLIGYQRDTGLTDAGYPFLEDVNTNHTGVTMQSTIDGYARSYGAVHRRPVEAWSATVRIDGTNPDGHPTSAPKLGEADPGDDALFDVKGHDWVPDGQYRRRVLGMASVPSRPTSVRLIIPATEGTI